VKLAKILAENQIPGSQNISLILPGILPRFAAGSENLAEIPRYTAGILASHTATNFFWSHHCLNKG